MSVTTRTFVVSITVTTIRRKEERTLWEGCGRVKGCSSQLASCLPQTLKPTSSAQGSEPLAKALASPAASILASQVLSVLSLHPLLSQARPGSCFSGIWKALIPTPTSRISSLMVSFLPPQCAGLPLQAQLRSPFSMWSSYSSCTGEWVLPGRCTPEWG